MLSEDELELLEAIRLSGSLSQAAARLGKAPSSVSRAARLLEERLDTLLGCAARDRRLRRLERCLGRFPDRPVLAAPRRVLDGGGSIGFARIFRRLQTNGDAPPNGTSICRVPTTSGHSILRRYWVLTD
jgi:hypothetical protein